jgi:hypothetical protein
LDDVWEDTSPRVVERPAAIVLMATGALLELQGPAGILPGLVSAVEPDRVSGLDLDDAIAAAAGDAQDVPRDLRQAKVLDRHAGRLRRLRAAKTASPYSCGIASAGPRTGLGATAVASRRAASAASFSICLGVGIRQLAGLSVMPQIRT